MKTKRLPIGALAGFLILAASWTLAEPDLRTQALAAYEDARYDEARGLLTRLDTEGQAGGADLYRLYYCQTVADMPEARETQRRAIAALEGELATATDAEVPFYLANAYRNVGRLTDMKRVATEATSRVESEQWPEPENGVWAFRLGKLYADQGQESRAAGWYERAVTMLVDEGQSDSTYAKWASRYLGRRAFDNGDFESAARNYGLLLDNDAGTVEDLDRLAVASSRLSRHQDAARAWRRAVILAPATSDRSRYAAQLSDAAEKLGGLPDKTPAGTDWQALGRAELEQMLADQANQGRTIVGGAQGLPTTKAEYAELKARIDAVHGLFVRAGLEYVLQGYPIRETAFRSGYAPMIFRTSEWQVHHSRKPRDGAARAKRKAKAKAPAD